MNGKTFTAVAALCRPRAKIALLASSEQHSSCEEPGRTSSRVAKAKALREEDKAVANIGIASC